MSEALTREALLQLLAEQAAQITRLIEQNSEQAQQIKALIEDNARLKKRIEQLERQVKRYVAPHSRETPKADPKPPGRRAGQGTFTFKQAPARDTVTRVIDVEPANQCPFCQTPLDGAAYKTDLAWITELPNVQPEIIQYNVPVTTCPTCGKDVRGEHPDLCRTQRGATAHRLGSRLIAEGAISAPRPGAAGAQGTGRVARAVWSEGDAECGESGHHPHDGCWNPSGDGVSGDQGRGSGCARGSSG